MELNDEIKQRIDDYFDSKTPEEIYTISKKYGFLVEQPNVSVSDDNNNFTLHNYVNSKGNVILNRSEASLLYIELHEFLMTNEDGTKKG